MGDYGPKVVDCPRCIARMIVNCSLCNDMRRVPADLAAAYTLLCSVSGVINQSDAWGLRLDFLGTNAGRYGWETAQQLAGTLERKKST